jgi:hypothetical protein
MSATMPASVCAVALVSESRFAVSNQTSPNLSLVALFTALEPRKPAAALADFAGIGVRAAELALHKDDPLALSGPSIANLLRSRVGDRVLDLLLGSAVPAWRAAELRLMGVAALERELDQLEQKRRHLEALLQGRR